MGVEIDVSTRQQEYFAGDVVEGVVRVDVTAKGAEGSPANELVLRLVGLAKTRVMSQAANAGHTSNGTQTYSDRQMVTENIEFLSFDMQLASFGGKAASGTHTFPFSVALPSGLPPSMEESSSRGGTCVIAYSFEARLHRPGVFKLDGKGNAQLKVLGDFHKTIKATPVSVGPSTRTVKKMCCFNSGSMSIGFETDHSIVRINDAIELILVANNDSTSQVNAMQVEIVQICTWYAHGYKEKKTRILASTVVAGSELGEMQRAVGTGDRRGRSPDELAGDARRDLKERLAVGAGTRCKLLVPDNCLLTVRTGFVEVTHLLGMQLKTPFYTSSPNIWMHLRVHPASKITGHPEVDRVEPSFVEDGTHASAVKVYAHKKPKPVSVPPSAVTIKCSTETPQGACVI